MFGILRFMKIFDNFLSPNQVDLSAHCFYYFPANNTLVIRCNNIDFPMEISVLKFQTWQFDGKPAFYDFFLNDQNTLEMSSSHSWFSHV